MPRSLILQRALACAVMSLSVAAQGQLPAPPATTQEALHEMFDQAGVAFTGQVIAIRHVVSANGSSGTLEIDFAVDDALRGAASGGRYTLREWAGLAPNGDTPFLIGRRYLMLLHAPGASGLTSPVGGPDGIIPILPGNDAASPSTPDALGLTEEDALAQPSRSPARTNLRIAAIQTDSSVAALASANIDLRWIAARVLAPVAYAPSEPAAARPITSRAYSIPSAASFPAPDADRVSTANSNPSVPAVTAGAEPASPSLSYSGLFTLLRSWQVQSHAAR